MPKSKFDAVIAPNIEKIKRWAEKGATQEEIAKKLRIGVSTFRKYLALGNRGKEPYVELVDAFACACEVADDEVEAAMYRRCCGISYTEDTYGYVTDPETGEQQRVIVKSVTKFIPPDPTSIQFWLTNRRPGSWRYKPQEDAGSDGGETGVVMLAPVMDNPGPPEVPADE